MRQSVQEHLKAIFAMHQDLAETLPDEAFSQKLSVPSNTVRADTPAVMPTRRRIC